MKLVKMMRYLKSTVKELLTLRADELSTIKWYTDASFAVHPDFRSHTGAVVTMRLYSLCSMKGWDRTVTVARGRLPKRR
jgi:hypothetical protein